MPRSSNRKRKQQAAPLVGKEFMPHRKHASHKENTDNNDDAASQSSESDASNDFQFVRSDDDDTVINAVSIVHRYGSEVGFKKGIVDEQEMKASDVVRDACMQADADASERISGRVSAQANLEGYVLAVLGKTGYAKHLNELLSELDKTGETTRFEYMEPPSSVLTTWVKHMRRPIEVEEMSSHIPGRGNSYGSIDNQLSGVSSVMKQFSGRQLVRTELLGELLKNYQKEDEKFNRRVRAQPIDLETDLYIMHNTLYGKKCRLPMWKKHKLWAQFLVQKDTISRASCVTVHCPLIEEIELPRNILHYDSVGIPMHVKLAWRNWKGRRENVGEQRFIAIGRNLVEPMFCPVLALMRWLNILSSWGIKDGKIFIDDECKSSREYRESLRNWFKKCEVEGSKLHLCTSHSVRRTAAQWAARCGYDINRIMDIGRWRDVRVARFYVGVGTRDHDNALSEHDGVDPIFSICMMKTYVICTE